MLFYWLLLIVAVAARLLPHPANVAPIGALALFVGAIGISQTQRTNRWAILILPIVALFISDWMIGFYTWQVMLSVYIGFILSIGIGLLVRQYSNNWLVIAYASLASSCLFFLLTNAAVWAFTPMYSKGMTGLIESYIMALPFFRNSVFGDLLYTGVFFCAYQLASNKLTINQLTNKLANQ